MALCHGRGHLRNASGRTRDLRVICDGTSQFRPPWRAAGPVPRSASRCAERALCVRRRGHPAPRRAMGRRAARGPCHPAPECRTRGDQAGRRWAGHRSGPSIIAAPRLADRAAMSPSGDRLVPKARRASPNCSPISAPPSQAVAPRRPDARRPAPARRRDLWAWLPTTSGNPSRRDLSNELLAVPTPPLMGEAMM